MGAVRRTVTQPWCPDPCTARVSRFACKDALRCRHQFHLLRNLLQQRKKFLRKRPPPSEPILSTRCRKHDTVIAMQSKQNNNIQAESPGKESQTMKTRQNTSAIETTSLHGLGSSKATWMKPITLAVMAMRLALAYVGAAPVDTAELFIPTVTTSAGGNVDMSVEY